MKVKDLLTVDLDNSTPAKAAQKITLIGMILDIIIGLLKLVVGFIFNSVALVADGIHSFTDVLTDFLVLWVTRFSHQEPDEDHPYGHERFETLGTLLLGSILIAVAGAMAWDSLMRLISQSGHVIASWPTVVAALLSIAGKEWIYRYTRDIGEKLNSKLLIANAWHSRTDAFSSIVVLVALFGAMAGYPWLDALAGFIVAIIIAKVGWDLAWDNIKILVDTSASAEETQLFLGIIKGIDGVKSVHCLRSRHMGNDLLLDVHLQVASRISVSEGHQIGLEVSRALKNAFPQIRDITYHIDAENDGDGSEFLLSHVHEETKHSLPLRKEIMKNLTAWWGDILNLSDCEVRLHYLKNQVHIDLFINHAYEQNPTSNNLRKQLINNANADWLGKITIWYKQH